MQAYLKCCRSLSGCPCWKRVCWDLADHMRVRRGPHPRRRASRWLLSRRGMRIVLATLRYLNVGSGLAKLSLIDKKRENVEYYHIYKRCHWLKSPIWEALIPGVTPMFRSRFSSTMDRLFLPSSAIRSRSPLEGSTKPPPPIPPSLSPLPFCKCSMLGLLEDVDKLWTELDRDGTAGKMTKEGDLVFWIFHCVNVATCFCFTPGTKKEHR